MYTRSRDNRGQLNIISNNYIINDCDEVLATVFSENDRLEFCFMMGTAIQKVMPSARTAILLKPPLMDTLNVFMSRSIT